MPLSKSDEKGMSKWYNNNYSECKIAVLKFAKANNAILFESENEIHMQIGLKDIRVSFICEENTKISIVVKTILLKTNKFINRFYLEIGQFLEEVEK